MSEYKESLIKRLRDKYKAYDVTGNHNSGLIFKEAADVIEAAERINEGWKIIGNIPAGESEFVLGYNENNKCTPYVTWACTKRDEQYSYYWGHYHNDLKVATLDMIDRAKNSLKGM